jgi:hypothetical protein
MIFGCKCLDGFDREGAEVFSDDEEEGEDMGDEGAEDDLGNDLDDDEYGEEFLGDDDEEAEYDDEDYGEDDSEEKEALGKRGQGADGQGDASKR